MYIQEFDPKCEYPNNYSVLFHIMIIFSSLGQKQNLCMHKHFERLCQCQSMAACLPYFDGNYFLIAIQIIQNIVIKEDVRRKSTPQGRRKNSSTSKGFHNFFKKASNDLQLMKKSKFPYLNICRIVSSNVKNWFMTGPRFRLHKLQSIS